MTARLPGLPITEALQAGNKARSTQIPRASRLNHFFPNIMKPDDLRSFAFIKVAGNGVFHHRLKLQFRIGNRKYRMAQRPCGIAAIGRVFNEEYDFVHFANLVPYYNARTSFIDAREQ